MYENVGLVMICKEKENFVNNMIKYHPELNEVGEVIIIDSEGGEPLRDYATYYTNINLGLGEARKYGIGMASKEYTLIVDVDVELPKNFIENSLEILDKHKDTAVVAIDFNPMQGHLGMGASIWRSNMLKELYNWDKDRNRRCECCTLWKNVRKKGYKIESLIVRAIHHREV